MLSTYQNGFHQMLKTKHRTKVNKLEDLTGAVINE